MASDSQFLELFVYLEALDIILNISTFIIVFICSYVIFKYPVFHTNLIRIVKCVFVFYTIAQLTRLIVAIEDFISEVQFGFYDHSVNILVGKDTGIFQIFEIIRLWGLIGTFSAMGTAIMERTYATMKLKTYETTVSNKFFGFCLGYQLGCSCAATFVIYIRFINIIVVGSLIVASNLLFCLHLFFLKKYNEKCHQTSLSDVNRYSLSERFQLQENIKTIGLIGRIGITLFFLHIFAGSIMAASYWFSTPTSQRIAYICLQIFFSLYGYSVAFAAILANPLWTSKLRQFVKSIFTGAPIGDKDYSRRDFLSQILRGSKGQRIIFSIDEEKEVYFKQLQNGWN